MIKRGTITLLFWVFLSIFFCIESWRLGLGSFKVPGPGFFPFLASLVIGLLAVILFWRERKSKLVEKAVLLFKGKKIGNVIFILGFLFAYPLLLDELGFFLCTLFFVGFSIKMFKQQKLKVVLGISISVTIVAYLLFNVWLTIPLPKGVWIEKLFH